MRPPLVNHTNGLAFQGSVGHQELPFKADRADSGQLLNPMGFAHHPQHVICARQRPVMYMAGLPLVTAGLVHHDCRRGPRTGCLETHLQFVALNTVPLGFRAWGKDDSEPSR